MMQDSSKSPGVYIGHLLIFLPSNNCWYVLNTYYVLAFGVSTIGLILIYSYDFAR